MKSRFPEKPSVGHSCRMGRLLSVLLAVASLGLGEITEGGEFRFGATTVNITPDVPVALWGQMHTRISTGIESPVTASVIAIESVNADQTAGSAVFVACDVVAIPHTALQAVRQRVAVLMPDFPVNRIILSGTHTHTAPVMLEGVYDIPAEGVMSPTEYVGFFAERVAQGIAEAWNSRASGKIGWGFAQAIVAQNRRSVYTDGTAAMYGATNRPDFQMIEGYEDHGVECLYFWNAAGQLMATAINVACPSQEVEGGSAINADFWHTVREALRTTHGPQLTVLAWTGAAGDQSPHLMYRKKAEERMRTLRGIGRLEEISRRIVVAWDEALAGAQQEQFSSIEFAHSISDIELPRRIVLEREWQLAREKIADLSKQSGRQTLLYWHGGVVRRYEAQLAGTVVPYTMELHVVRLGDIVVTTNPFELYTDYGIQMKSRSPALQTFVIQLAGPGTYLPSARAAAGGGYSAIAESNEVGPEGGQVLVEETLREINALWSAVPVPGQP